MWGSYRAKNSPSAHPALFREAPHPQVTSTTLHHNAPQKNKNHNAEAQNSPIISGAAVQTRQGAQHNGPRRGRDQGSMGPVRGAHGRREERRPAHRRRQVRAHGAGGAAVPV